MGIPVHEMLDRIPSPEIVEWMVFYNLEPWGANIENHRAGLMMSLFANANRDISKNPDGFHPTDFLPIDYGPEAEKPVVKKKDDEETKEERAKRQQMVAHLMKNIFGGELKNVS